MKDEIKEIEIWKEKTKGIFHITEYTRFWNYITNLKEENKRLKEIAQKMHLWIFLHSDDEQKVYDEIGLTEEENTMLGYSGQFRLQGEDKE